MTKKKESNSFSEVPEKGYDPSFGFVPALGYAWLTPLYDATVRLLVRERVFKSALIDQAAIADGAEVLDLACGTGTLAIGMKTRVAGARITGLDADPAILRIAARKTREAGVEIRLDQGFSVGLPYAEASFDRVVTSLFFHHLSLADKRATAAQVYRVLRPGGELHIADWGKPSNRLMRALFLPVQWLDGFANTRDNVAGKLPALFEEAGFEGVRQTRDFSTVLGTLALYRAAKPGAIGGSRATSLLR